MPGRTVVPPLVRNSVQEVHAYVSSLGATNINRYSVVGYADQA